jgi:hypothetical protein
MHYMDKRLSQLQSFISSLIADSLVDPIGESISRDTIASQLTEEISVCTRVDQRGRTYAPDQYTLSMNPSDFEDLHQTSPQIQTELSNALSTALGNADFIAIREPHITLATDPTLERSEIRVIAWHSSDPLQFSKEINEEKIEQITQPPAGAFFIIEGKRYFSLDQKVIKIGRRLDNHIILEDRHVSRSHARLEVVEGRYVLIDLDSTAGTRINGRLITRHTLRPGDIVSIAAVQMIYGEDPGGPPEDATLYKTPPSKDDERDQVTPLNLHMKSDRNTAPYDKDKKI